MADRISGLVQVTSREPINHNMLETIQQMAHKILGFGCMPLVPSTRRNWDRDEILKLEGTTISWPPHGWKKNEFRPTKTNVGIRSYNHRAENHVLQCINRTDLLDKYNYLARLKMGNILTIRFEVRRDIIIISSCELWPIGKQPPVRIRNSLRW